MQTAESELIQRIHLRFLFYRVSAMQKGALQLNSSVNT